MNLLECMRHFGKEFDGGCMNNMNVGLLGAVVNNGNMGCVALTYSLIHMMEEIGRELGTKFTYYIFEGEEDKDKTNQLCNKLSIEVERVYSIKVTTLHRFRSMAHHPLISLKALESIKKCEFVIDLTSGDSFSDIYGQWRFDGATHIKEIVHCLKVPMILGPQTYGPFEKARNQKKAKKVIKNAYCVISRDHISADYVASFTDKKVHVTTDLAFGLPYENSKQKDLDRIKVGINISSLLVKNKEESTEVNFSLKADYDGFIQRILNYLVKDERYDVYVIPHVGNDAGEQFKEEFPMVNYLDEFSNPMDAKNCIAGMDIFIGARMHATIGAFSSGVATIPTAYSRKFSGLYENLNYPYVVDLSSLSTEDAVIKTISYVEAYTSLKDEAKYGRDIAQDNLKQTKAILLECIASIINSDERKKHTRTK